MIKILEFTAKTILAILSIVLIATITTSGGKDK